MQKANFKGADNVFSKRLKNLMSNNGVTQDMLAQVLDVKRQTISLYINGASVPPLEKFVDIANYFNVSTDYLLGLCEVSTKDESIRNVSNFTNLNENAVRELLSSPLDIDFKNSIAYKTIFDDYLGLKEYFNYVPKIRNTIIESGCFNSLISSAAICRVVSDISKKVIVFSNEQYLKDCDAKTLDFILDFCNKWKREYNYQIFNAQNEINNFIRRISFVDEDEIATQLKEIESLIDYIRYTDLKNLHFEEN